jgi:hypothetical protein
MLKTANRADEQISEPPGTNAMFTLHHRDRMGCGGACLLRLRAKERPDILLKYSLSKYSLNLALLGYDEFSCAPAKRFDGGADPKFSRTVGNPRPVGIFMNKAIRRPFKPTINPSGSSFEKGQGPRRSI